MILLATWSRVLHMHAAYPHVITGGKRDEELVLPVNSSLSVTLGQEQVRAKNQHFCSNTL